jgi:excisionase family DNA binding protein
MRTPCRTRKSKRQLLRIPQAVEYLNGVIAPGTLRQWVFHRKIESIRVGGAVCIPADALDELIERGRVAK